MVDGKAYAFAFDDVGAFESLVHDGDPRAAGIVLSPFTGGGGGGGNTGAVPVISNLNGKCIDVPDANFADGARLQMWGCNNTNAQKWSFTGGTLRSENNKCMDVAGGSTAGGAAIQLYTCNGTGAQQFVHEGNGTLRNPQSNRCVDIDAWNANDGARLVLWDCHAGANQTFRKG
jgi:hypothetical protein